MFSNVFKQHNPDGAERGGIVVVGQGGDNTVYLLDGVKASLKDVEIMLEIFEDGL
jgi:hypothetical protein